MEIKAAIFDIDGTLVPYGALQPSAAVCRAVGALRQKGVVVIAATGRALFNAKQALGPLVPDYYACVNGNWITDANGRLVYENRLSTEEMYALVDYFEDYDLPLNFVFDDGYYPYVEYAAYAERYRALLQKADFLFDGEDQVRHLQSMPYAASAMLNAAQVDAFTQKYGYLGLRFVSFFEGNYDILRAGTDKAASVQQLLARLGIAWENVAAFGDGNNDAELLQAAGFSVAMENGAEALKQTADVIAPPAQQDGVAAVLQAYLL